MKRISEFFFNLQNSKNHLTLWMNNLIVVYMFFIPISASVTSKIFIAILSLFLFRGNVVEHLKEAWKNGVVRALSYWVLMYLIWLIGCDNLKEGWNSFGHVKSALYIFLFLAIIDGRYINRILGAFIMGMMLSELLSYSMFFGIIPWEFNFGGHSFYRAYAIGDPSPFQHHIHYGVLLAFTVVLLAQKVLYAKEDIWLKAVILIFTITASINIFVTGGRTGYIAFFPLLALFFFYYHRKWIVPALLAISLFAGVMYQSSDLLQHKVGQTVTEVEKILQPSADFQSSLGQRIGFWVYSVEVIKDNFLLGVGTGDSMSEVFARVLPKDEGVKSIAHEHNQYISTLLQFGFIGLLIFLNVFYQIYKYRPKDENLRFIQLAITLAIGMAITMTIFNLRVFIQLWILILAVSMIDRGHRTIQGAIQDNRVFLVQAITLGFVFYTMVFLMKVF